MDLERVELLKTSFARLSTNPEETALLFYARLFALNPALRPLFTTALPEQAEKFMRMLAFIIGGLHRPSTIIGEVKSLGVRHMGYGTLAAHYDVVGEALLWAIDQRLGPHSTPAIKAAWREAFFLMAGLMKEAAMEAAGSNEP
jgi:hemoglobin-like flavoprotein